MIAPAGTFASGASPLERLLQACAAVPSAVVGFSAGVDSTVPGMWRTMPRLVGSPSWSRPFDS